MEMARGPHELLNCRLPLGWYADTRRCPTSYAHDSLIHVLAVILTIVLLSTCIIVLQGRTIQSGRLHRTAQQLAW